MGRSIVYCDKCGHLLREEDFRQGKAVVADNRNFCAGCRPASSIPNPVATPQAKKASSSRIPKQPPAETISSSRIPKQSQRGPVQPPGAPAPTEPSTPGSKGVWIGLGVAAVVIASGALLAGGSKDRRRMEEPAPSPAVVVAAVPPPNVEKLNPEERRREEAARAACVKAYEVQTLKPRDLVAQWRAFEAAAAASQGTSYAADAATQLGKLRRKLDEERSAVEARAQDVMSREQFQPALEIWEGEKSRFDIPEWTGPVGQRIAELKSEFERRLGAMREAAVEARKRGDEAEAQRIRARVAGWGVQGYAAQIDQALAGVTPTKPDPTPAVPPAKALEAYRARWQELVAPAADPVKAMETLAAETKGEAAKEAAEDLENVRLAAALLHEGAAMLPRLAKGQKAALAYWDRSGAPAKAEDTVLKVDGQRVEIKVGEGSIVIPFGEIAASTLADLVKGRDKRAAAVACFLDGDAEGAQRAAGGPIPQVNEKYAEAAKALFERRTTSETEGAARKLFYEAEASYFDFGDVGEAAAKYKTLLAEHAATAFVKRNRAAIAARAEVGARDFLFSTSDMVVTPGFKLGKYGKVDAAWASQQDVDPAKLKESFVQLEFWALPEAEYRCWILAGGCCQEVLTFHVQGTDLVGPDPANPKEKVAVEPGGAVALMVKSMNLSVKKLHAQHNGPKSPERFDWVQAGTFKYPAAGRKLLRILTNQKGFAVGSAAVLGTRPGPPRELDFKELERWRAETPGASLRQGGVMTGCILREVFRDIDGTSVGELTGMAAFKEDRPSERATVTSFETPQDIGDRYGTRIRGYVHPPVSGAYVFWIASDDTSELWLSTDEDPAHKERIAFAENYTSPREYEKYAGQKSKPIELKVGRRYYIEALHKEGGGGDHVSVRWQLPTGQLEGPIPGSRLSPFVPAKK